MWLIILFESEFHIYFRVVSSWVTHTNRKIWSVVHKQRQWNPRYRLSFGRMWKLGSLLVPNVCVCVPVNWVQCVDLFVTILTLKRIVRQPSKRNQFVVPSILSDLLSTLNFRRLGSTRRSTQGRTNRRNTVLIRNQKVDTLSLLLLRTKSTFCETFYVSWNFYVNNI